MWEMDVCLENGSTKTVRRTGKTQEMQQKYHFVGCSNEPQEVAIENIKTGGC